MKLTVSITVIGVYVSLESWSHSFISCAFILISRPNLSQCIICVAFEHYLEIVLMSQGFPEYGVIYLFSTSSMVAFLLAQDHPDLACCPSTSIYSTHFHSAVSVFGG